MDAFSTRSNRDALQPNEQEIDVQAVWGKIRVWVIGTGVALLLAGCGVWFYFYVEQRRENIELTAQSVLTTASDEQTLEAVVQQYPQTDSAAQALILLGYGKCQRHDWAAARGYYQRLYENKYNIQSRDLIAAALFGIGITHEAEKNFDQALQAYDQLPKSFPNSFKVVEAKLAAARVHDLKGEVQKARQIYEDILVSDQQSSWKQEAEHRLKIIKAGAKGNPQTAH